jgi:hypothetical protein
MKLTLKSDGDRFEKRWQKEIVPLIPEFEEFWRRNIVPLTFRTADEPLRSRFLRPSQKGFFVDYADANYAAFYHLALCFHWLEKISDHADNESYDTETALWGSEAVYCFFSHAVSAYDASANFCRAVNRVAEKFAHPRVFNVEDDKKKPLMIYGLENGDDFDELSDLIRELRSYRNILVHERVVFLQNGYLPSPRLMKVGSERDLLWQRAGLAVIGLFARDFTRWQSEGTFERDFVRASDLAGDQIVELCTRLKPVWSAATEAFDELEQTSGEFNRRGQINSRDRKLTEEAFARARQIGRR